MPFPSVFGSLWTPHRAAAWTALFLFLLTASAYFCGVNAKRALQHAVFIVPFIALWLLSLPARSNESRSGWQKVCLAAAVVGLLLAFIDAALRAFLYQTYSAEPMSTFVLESAANTNLDEDLGFLATEWTGALLGTLLSLAALTAALFVMHLASKTSSDNAMASGWGWWFWRFWMLLFASVCILSWAKPSWRIHYPPIFWSKWMESVAGMQSIWMKADQHEAAEITEARSVLLDASPAPRTIVLVIGESTTRDDWSLYGYSRDTTPKLKALESKDSNLGTFRQAWSVDASTISAFRSMFTFPVPQSAGDGRINLFALFSAAGWTVHWISNQDDIAIQTQYAVFASEAQFINRMTGRSSASMDLNVLPTFKQALADPAPRKLIVVHLIGAHPHYALRFRDSDEIDWGHDQVIQNLNHLDRSPWVVAARNQYDWAMRYQDEVLSELFHLSKNAQASAKSPLDWIFLSDHGQELGDTANRAGHSQTALSSYRIPFLIWSSERSFNPYENRPFRADFLSPLLLELAGINWKGEDPRQVLIADDYSWMKPHLPIQDPQMPSSDTP